MSCKKELEKGGGHLKWGLEGPRLHYILRKLTSTIFFPFFGKCSVCKKLLHVRYERSKRKKRFFLTPSSFLWGSVCNAEEDEGESVV